MNGDAGQQYTGSGGRPSDLRHRRNHTQPPLLGTWILMFHWTALAFARGPISCQFQECVQFYGILCFLLVGCSHAQPAADEATVNLHEVGFAPLPASFRPTGALAAPHGNVVLWSTSDSSALLRGPRGWTRLDVGAPVVAACWYPSDRVSVMADDASIITYDSTGAPRSRHSLRPTVELTDGACSRESWYALTRSGAVYRTVGLDSDQLVLVRESWSELAGVDPREIDLVAAADDGILLSSTVYPYSAVHYRAATDASFSFSDVTDINVPEELKTGTGVWYSLPTVYVSTEDVYLRTIADTQTDNRLVLLYDLCGRVRRSRGLRAPIGFAAAAGDTVYAIRYAGRLELVTYSLRPSDDKGPFRC